MFFFIFLVLCTPVADCAALWLHLAPPSAPLSPTERAAAAAALHPHTVTRRRRGLATNSPKSALVHARLDREVDADCVRQVEAAGHGLWRVRTVSRWFNAIAVKLLDAAVESPEVMRRVSALSCVVRVEPVRALVPRSAAGDDDDDHHHHKSDDDDDDDGHIKEVLLEPATTAAAPATGSGGGGDDDDDDHSAKAADPLAASAVDPFYGKMVTQLAFAGIDALHRRGFNGSGVVVAVLDSGFNHSHAVFERTRVLDQRDFVDGDNETQSELGAKANYHGTSAFSILAASQEGVAVGAAFGASFLLARTENIYVEERVEEDFFVAGCEWAERAGASVISASLGYKLWYKFDDFNGETPLVSRAAAHAVELGLFVAIANGNEGHTGIGAPADAKLVVSVGAVTPSGHRSSFSSMGPSADGRLKPDVVTLGNDIVVASDQGGLRTGSGSSYATPLVAGLAALLMQMHPHWSAQMVQEAILNTASQVDAPDVHVGRGLVNATRAATYAPRVACLAPLQTSSSDSAGESDSAYNSDYVPFRCFNDGHCDGPTNGAFCQCRAGFYGRDCSLQAAGPSAPGNWTYLVNTTYVGNHDGLLMPGGDGVVRMRHRGGSAAMQAGFLHSNLVLTGGAMLCLLLIGLRVFRCVVERTAPSDPVMKLP